MRLAGFLGVSLVATLVCTAAARGGMLAVDNNALMDWRGTALFTSGSLSVNVDYAVYPPGNFDLSFGSLADPSGNTQYVYAYQVLNDTGGTQAAIALTVGFADMYDSLYPAPEGPKLPQNIGNVAIAGDPSAVVPSAEVLNPPANPTSAVWNFSPTVVPAGGNSDILIYTSPNPPEWEVGTVQGSAGGTFATKLLSLPSPVPEPASGLLLAAGAGFLVAIRACRRRG